MGAGPPLRDDQAEACKHALGDEELYTSVDAKKLYADKSCQLENVLCLKADGFRWDGETLPRLRPGAEIQIRHFGPDKCKGLLEVTVDEVVRTTVLFRPSSGTELQDATDAPPPEEPILEEISSTLFRASDRTESMTIVIARTDIQASAKGETLKIDLPTYYLDVGLLAAFTYNGDRKVTTATVAGSEDQFMRVEENIKPSAAIALTWFFCGQYSAPRFSGLNGLGLQVGIGANFDRLDDEFYGGLAYEPIPGLGVSVGAALQRLERLQPTHQQGTLVTGSSIPKDEFLAVRPYLGITLNTEVLQTARALGGKVSVP